jgi:hypothetical protein
MRLEISVSAGRKQREMQRPLPGENDVVRSLVHRFLETNHMKGAYHEETTICADPSI